MRPVTLTMKAFGSFAQETTVPFEELQNGLYLVVGETGAGKTTIFDAIVFALFGTASGTSRRPEMLHSDFVEKSEDTVVALTFDHGGRRYTARRTIHFRKKRGTENEYGDIVKDAVFEEPDEVVNGYEKVTARCETLLGMDADRFRKIVMLAQGEFRNFLYADSDEKSRILGKLFDNSSYVRYQNLLAAARSVLREQRGQYQTEIGAALALLQLPEGTAEETRNSFLPEHPRLLENLDQLVADGEGEQTRLKTQLQSAQNEVDALNKQLGAAEGDNKTLDALATVREDAAALEKRRGAMEALEQQYLAAETALRRVKPALEKRELAQKNAREAETETERLRRELNASRDCCERAQADVDGDKEYDARLKELHAELQRIEASLPDYDALEQKKSALNAALKAVTDVQSDIKKLEKMQNSTEEQRKTVQARLEELKDAETEVFRTEQEYQTAKEHTAALEDVSARVEAVEKDEAALRTAAEELETLTAEARGAEGRHHTLYQAFLAGQAGIMAHELEKTLQDEGYAACPVCGSEFHAGQSHTFAPLSEGTPTEDVVNEAKADFDRREALRIEKHTAVEKRKAALRTSKTTLLGDAQKLLPDCGDWETLSCAGYLKTALEQLQVKEGDAESKRREAIQMQEQKTELEKTEKELSAFLADLSRGEAEKKETEKEKEGLASSLSGEIGAIQTRLPFVDRQGAENRKRELKQEYDAVDRRVNEHKEELRQAQEKFNKTQGKLSEREKELPALLDEAETAETAFNDALSAAGFSDAAAYEAALGPVGGTDGENWLSEKQKELNDYRNDRKNTGKRIEELCAQTEGMVYTNLEALKRQIAEVSEKRDAANTARAEQEKLLDNHRETRRRVADARNALTASDGVWARLDRLADLAVGANAEGGKLSFERYVMGAIFKEVVDMANRRLDIMSGGQYVLKHTLEAGRRNASAGLELEVMDIATGKQRPASSLSGGETFQVSLSLALGLSDVVQGHAGGIGLDTLFIDEGFGALDSGALDSAITVLNQLTEGNRLVGIISHVDKLEESIPQKLRVKKTVHGSILTHELS